MKLTIKAVAVLFVALLLVAGSFFTSSVSSQTRSATVKALVGGTLIDGYGSKTIRNSVVIIEGAHQGGRAGWLACDTAGRGSHFHGGHERVAGSVGHARPPHDQRP